MKILDIFATLSHTHTPVRLPYIIAEVGVNHEGKMELAKRLIEEALEGGANAVKFQTYKAETIASIKSPAYWDTTQEPTQSQFELFKKYDKFWKTEFEELKKHCDAFGIEFMSTPFDTESARFLNDLMDVFKISSSDITNRPFIELIASFGKPIILSTGASYLHEIEEALSWIKFYGNPMSLLHCVLNYPTDDANSNLGMITSLCRKFPNCIIGYSDHTLPNDMKTLELATLLGAMILEKHFTHDKTLAGNDHYHAMDKEDLKHFKSNLSRIFQLIGSYDKRPVPSEEPARLNARRSLVAARPIRIGAIVSMKDLTWKRPGSGVSPKFINDVVGRIALKDITVDDVITWGILGD